MRFQKGQPPWNKGRKLSEEYKRKLSLAHQGKPLTEAQREGLKCYWQTLRGRSLSVAHRAKISVSHFGIKPTEETRRKLSDSHKGHTRSLEERQKQSQSFRKALAEGRVLFHKPNKAELRLESILNKHFRGQWSFVGDGSVPIGGLFPDFIHRNGRNLIIELFGDYWHGRTPRYKVTEFRQTEHGKRIIYARYGYALLVIWESELENETGVVNRVREFVGQIVGG